MWFLDSSVTLMPWNTTLKMTFSQLFTVFGREICGFLFSSTVKNASAVSAFIDIANPIEKYSSRHQNHWFRGAHLQVNPHVFARRRTSHARRGTSPLCILPSISLLLEWNSTFVWFPNNLNIMDSIHRTCIWVEIRFSFDLFHSKDLYWSEWFAFL